MFLLELLGMSFMCLGTYCKATHRQACVQQGVTDMFRDFKFCDGVTEKVRVAQARVKNNNPFRRWAWSVSLKSLLFSGGA